MCLIPAIPPKFCAFNAPAFSPPFRHSPFHSLLLSSFHFLFLPISFPPPSFETLLNSALVTSCNLREKVSVPASLQPLSPQVSKKKKKQKRKRRLLRRDQHPTQAIRHLSKSSNPNTPTASLASRLCCSSCFCTTVLPQEEPVRTAQGCPSPSSPPPPPARKPAFCCLGFEKQREPLLGAWKRLGLALQRLTDRPVGWG